MRNRFSIGSKRRLPASTTFIENGKYKGLTMYTWSFRNLNIIRNIFTTNTVLYKFSFKDKSSQFRLNFKVALECERIFSKTAEGYYKYIQENNYYEIERTGTFRPILPTKYSTYIKLKSTNINRGTVSVTL